MNKAQGAIEYLLIIGVVILIVTVVVIALSGVLNSATEDTSQQEYQDSYLHMKYEHIGFPVAIKPGEHDSFTLALQPKNSSLPEIFKDAPNGTTVTINYDTTYTKTEGSWGTEGDEAKINKGDIVDVSVPASYSKPLELQIKGEYTRPQPRKIIIDCAQSTNGMINYMFFPFEPKEKRIKVLFKDFFEKLASGSSLHIGRNYYYVDKSCEGTPCIGLDKDQCISSSFCDWDRVKNECMLYSLNVRCEDQYREDECLRMGCTVGDTILIEQEQPAGTPFISMGDNFTLFCAPNQNFRVEIEENVENNIEKIEQLIVDRYSTKMFTLKNYSCYSFGQLYNKIKNAIPEGAYSYYNLICSRRNNMFFAEVINGSENFSSHYSTQLIYADTICRLQNSGTNISTVDFTCEN
ncbi:MAG: class III signal peptide-containing protein [Candidatus Iainarchaeum sp.]|jgi:hypothetical protein